MINIQLQSEILINKMSKILISFLLSVVFNYTYAGDMEFDFDSFLSESNIRANNEFPLYREFISTNSDETDKGFKNYVIKSLKTIGVSESQITFKSGKQTTSVYLNNINNTAEQQVIILMNKIKYKASISKFKTVNSEITYYNHNKKIFSINSPQMFAFPSYYKNYYNLCNILTINESGDIYQIIKFNVESKNLVFNIPFKENTKPVRYYITESDYITIKNQNINSLY